MKTHKSVHLLLSTNHQYDIRLYAIVLGNTHLP